MLISKHDFTFYTLRLHLYTVDYYTNLATYHYLGDH